MLERYCALCVYWMYMDYLFVKFVTIIAGVATLYHGIVAVPRNFFTTPRSISTIQTSTSTAKAPIVKLPTTTAVTIRIPVNTDKKILRIPKPSVIKPPIIRSPAPTPALAPILTPVNVTPPLSPAQPSTTHISLVGILEATNAERAKLAALPLSANPILHQIANARLNSMFADQYFSHDAPDGTTFVDLIKDAGYRYSLIGENLAMGDFTTSDSIVTAWMNSPGHRANMLNSNYTEIGIAVAKRHFDDHDQWIAVQIFGKPR